MTRMTVPRALPLIMLIALGACRAAPPADQPGNEANVAAPAATPTPTPSPSASSLAITTQDDALEFDYRWPAKAAAIPALDQWLRGHADHQRKEAASDAAKDANLAKKRSYPFHTHSFVQRWSLVADTPALLVLQADGYVFTGGAHGMPFTSTLIWDKAAGKRLATTALIDPAVLARAAGDRFCKALDAQRAEKRGAPVDPNEDTAIPDFVRCVDMTKQEIVPLSTGGKAIDAIRIAIMPYAAGPYAEGIYAIDLPVDAAMQGAVRPAWRAAFAGS